MRCLAVRLWLDDTIFLPDIGCGARRVSSLCSRAKVVRLTSNCDGLEHDIPSTSILSSSVLNDHQVTQIVVVTDYSYISPCLK